MSRSIVFLMNTKLPNYLLSFILMAKYVENNLIEDEHIMYETTHHWIIFISWRSLITLFIYPIFKRWTDEFVLTNKRVVIKTGLIARDTVEMNLNRIETIFVDQSVLGRMLGYGTLEIKGIGGTVEKFLHISDPLEFRRKFQEQISD